MPDQTIAGDFQHAWTTTLKALDVAREQILEDAESTVRRLNLRPEEYHFELRTEYREDGLAFRLVGRLVRRQRTRA